MWRTFISYHYGAQDRGNTVRNYQIDNNLLANPNLGLSKINYNNTRTLIFSFESVDDKGVNLIFFSTLVELSLQRFG